MSKYVIGIDPDSKAHGVALYVDNELVSLEQLTLVHLATRMTLLEPYRDAIYHIENVARTKDVWHKGGKTAAVNVGLCIQAQRELERFLDSNDIKYVHHVPSKAWKKDKKQFELATGWTDRSNEDTRSAAYFGFLGCK